MLLYKLICPFGRESVNSWYMHGIFHLSVFLRNKLKVREYSNLLGSKHTKISTQSVPSRRNKTPGLASSPETRAWMFLSIDFPEPCHLSLGKSWQRLTKVAVTFFFLRTTQILIEFHGSSGLCVFPCFHQQGFVCLFILLEGKSSEWLTPYLSQREEGKW